MRSISLYLLALCVLGCSGEKRYDGYKVFRTIPKKIGQLRALRQLGDRLDEGFAFWKDSTRTGMPFDFMVSPQLHDYVINFLEDNGVHRPQTIIDDVQELMEKSKKPAPRTDAFDYETYNRMSAINQWIADMAASSPIATNGTIGNSYEGRPINYLKISNSSEGDKPVVVLEAALHAREWLCITTVIHMARYLLEGASGASELLDKFDFYILPVMNPDGYEYSHTDDRLWRKNRKPHPSSRCVGVDLNRNFDVSWGGLPVEVFAPAAESYKPCSLIYSGTSAFSEPESQALGNFLENTLGGGKRLDGTGDGQIALFVDYHNYGQCWLYPYAYRRWPGNKRRKIRPGIYDGDVNIDLKHRDLMDAGAVAAVDALRAVHNVSYAHGDVYSTIYAIAGDVGDYAYERLEIPFAYGTEGRDHWRYGEYGFLAPPSEIKPSAEENWEALKAVCGYVHDVYNP